MQHFLVQFGLSAQSCMIWQSFRFAHRLRVRHGANLLLSIALFLISREMVDALFPSLAAIRFNETPSRSACSIWIRSESVRCLFLAMIFSSKMVYRKTLPYFGESDVNMEEG